VSAMSAFFLEHRRVLLLLCGTRPCWARGGSSFKRMLVACKTWTVHLLSQCNVRIKAWAGKADRHA